MEVAQNHVVLVVDDDPDIRATLCDLLDDEGYQAVGLANGREALDYLGQHAPPCLVLLDLMMPVMDGLQFYSHLQAQPDLADLPIVVITAAGDRVAITIPVARVLAKPLRLNQLLEVLEQHC